MPSHTTTFGSLAAHNRGGVDIVDDDPKNYAFSNIFDVAAHAEPFEKVAVGKNLEYVLEAIRVEGESPWRTCTHDEFALCMEGDVTFTFVDLQAPPAPMPPHGSVALEGDPEGPRMGTVAARRGHMTLLPAGSAYRYASSSPAVLLLQTAESADTQYRWSEICQTAV